MPLSVDCSAKPIARAAGLGRSKTTGRLTSLFRAGESIGKSIADGVIAAGGSVPLMNIATAKSERRDAGDIGGFFAAPVRSTCQYSAIVLVSIILVANPLTLSTLLSLSTTRWIYIVIFDAYALAIVLFAIRYVRRERPRDAIAALGLLAAWPAVMIGAEIAIVSVHQAYVGAAEPDVAAAPRKPVMGDSVHDPDPLLGWVPRPGARVRHVSEGNFDVTYTIDANGRRAIPSPAGAQRTLHFFGDSFTFGHGVEDDQTALSIIARALGARTKVANYGVMAYGLEQMFLHLRAAKDEIRPGDVVIFTPVSLDLTRNLIDKYFVCFLYTKNYSQIDAYPWWDGSAWRPTRIADHCPQGDLPLALLQRYFLARQSGRDHATLVQNADRIFRMAKAIAAERGAAFQLIFLVYPNECLAKSFDFDLTSLETDFVTLMPYCLDDETMAHMRFATDRHLTPEGHQWAARALLDVLRRTVLSEDAP